MEEYLQSVTRLQDCCDIRNTIMADLANMKEAIHSTNINKGTIRFERFNGPNDNWSNSKLCLAIGHGFTVTKDKPGLFLVNLNKF